MFKSTFEKFGSKIAPLTFAAAVLVNSGCETKNNSDKAVNVETPQQSRPSEISTKIHKLAYGQFTPDRLIPLSQLDRARLGGQSLANIENNPVTRRLINTLPFEVVSILDGHTLDTQKPMTPQDLLDAVKPSGVDLNKMSDYISILEEIDLKELRNSIQSYEHNFSLIQALVDIAQFSKEFNEEYPEGNHETEYITHQLYLKASLHELENTNPYGIFKDKFPEAMSEYLEELKYSPAGQNLKKRVGVITFMYELGLEDIYSHFWDEVWNKNDKNAAIFEALLESAPNSIKTLDELKAYTKRINYYTKGYLNSPYSQQRYSLEKFLIEKMQNEMNK